MKTTTEKIFNELFRKSALADCKASVKAAFDVLLNTFANGKKLLLCGNGGSAADCEHIVGELAKSFRKKRPIREKFADKLKTYPNGEALSRTLEGGLKALSLTSHIALSTAFANDKEPYAVFAQQLYVLGDEGDTLLAISTSGNSRNCVYAGMTAKAKGLKVISLTGANESKLSKFSDVCIRVPETETFRVQELHLPIYHCLCAMLEEELF